MTALPSISFKLVVNDEFRELSVQYVERSAVVVDILPCSVRVNSDVLGTFQLLCSWSDIANVCLRGKMSTANSKKKLRSSVAVNVSNKNNQDVVQIPNIDKFQSTRLPLTKEVIGMVFAIKDQGNLDFDIATNKVTEMVMEHWKNQNVYTKTRKSVKQKLQTVVNEYRSLIKIDTSKGKPLERCKKFNDIADKLFDIHSNDSERVKSEGAKANVPMGSDEVSYLNSM